MLRIVMGQGHARRDAILALSMRMACTAQEFGLRVVSNKASRNACSSSRYLTLRDPGGRPWLIRVSNHRMPIRSSHPVPHLDLVSLDGASGEHEAAVFLHRIAMGSAEWNDPAGPARRAELKRVRGRRRP